MLPRVLVPLAWCLIGLFALAADDREKPKSFAQTKAKYEQSLRTAKISYDALRAKAAGEYRSELDKLIKAAIAAEDLDEAVKLRDAKNAIGKEAVAAAEGEEVVAAAPGGKSALREGAYRYGGAQYRLVLAGETWPDAREQRRKVGGDLVSVESKEEFNFLFEKFAAVSPWVGASFDPKRTVWEWTDGKPVPASGWAYNEVPNDAVFAYIRSDGYGRSGLHSESQQTTRRAYICEWKD